MKKVLSILLLIALCFTFTVPAFAAEGDYIIDDAQVIEDVDQFTELEELADSVFAEEKFATCFGTDPVAYTGSIEDAARNFFAEKVVWFDGVFLYVNTASQKYYIYTDGYLTESISSDDLDIIGSAFSEGKTYYEGVKAFISKSEELAKDVEFPEGLKLYLADGETLLNSDDANEVIDRFFDITERYSFDVIGMTKTNVGDYAAKEAADYFEANQYGYGDTRDGIILLISKTSNHEGIAALGSGLSKFPDEIMDYILDEVDVYRLNGQYKEAFLRYADLIEQELANPGTLKAAKAARDEAAEAEGMPMRIALEVITALVLGFLLAFIPTAIMSSKMNNVHMQDSAANYAVPGSMNVTTQKDIFLFNTVTRTKKVKQSSSSGGGGGVSSSGRSFSGSSR